jgi:hypothetical protein
MTIYQIKSNLENAPYFFDRKTLKCFGQTLKSFKVLKLENGNYFIEFNPTTNKFI